MIFKKQVSILIPCELSRVCRIDKGLIVLMIKNLGVLTQVDFQDLFKHKNIYQKNKWIPWWVSEIILMSNDK